MFTVMNSYRLAQFFAGCETARIDMLFLYEREKSDAKIQSSTSTLRI